MLEPYRKSLQGKEELRFLHYNSAGPKEMKRKIMPAE